MRVKVHKNGAARRRSHVLRKRLRIITANFYGTALAGFYRKNGMDPEQATLLPWMNLEEFHASAGSVESFRDFVAKLEALPFIRLSRKGPKPLIRLATKE